MNSDLKIKRNPELAEETVEKSGFKGYLDKKFKITERKSDIKTEVLAGITIFATCAYILAVNPAILSAAGMDPKAVFWATVLSAGFATIGMGLFANFPFALAPAMGLNAYFAFYVVGAVGLSWQNALGCVMISGVVFVILSLFKIRSKIVNEMPAPLKHGIGAGIGLFIAFIGLSNAGVVVKNHATIVAMGDLAQVCN